MTTARAEQEPTHSSFEALAELSALSWEWATKSPRLLAQMAKAARTDAPLKTSAQLHLSRAFARLAWRLLVDPRYVVRAQADLVWDTVALWSGAARRSAGQDVAPVVEPARRDRRFRDEAWDGPFFDFMKQSYLVVTRWLRATVDNTAGLDDETREMVSFYTRQVADALSPTNFPMTNPEVLRATMQSGGANLFRGMRRLMADIERGNGRLAIRRTDLDAFAVGESLAITPGKVVYQNELMQLIQYAPSGEQVHRRPLLIVPPWINKFYILDLQAKNSFVRWAVAQGFTVFVVSWINPKKEMADKSFDDYLQRGPLDALDAIGEATGERDVTAIGYCLGGTLLSATLAQMKACGDERIKAATFFTTLVDFEDPGELTVFIDDEQVGALVRAMRHAGVLSGARMQTAFNLLRANDLIWSYVVNNYLLGQDPYPFDLLYWNADSTRMPAAMHAYYLRNMYLENKLIEPGGLVLGGQPIDVSQIDVPTYILSCRDDHIAPWTSTYAATQLYRGPRRMVLAASGHIAGVINPPAAGRYCYWTNEALPVDPEAWLLDAERHEGSWWPDWAAWNREHSGELVPARTPGEGLLPIIEDAPGAYVHG